MHGENFASQWYREHVLLPDHSLKQVISPIYLGIVREIAEGTGIAIAEFMGCMHRGMKGLVSRLQSNVKTHKPPGQVSFRAIHASPACCFEPLSRFIQKELQKQLNKQKHLAFSAPEVISKIRSMQFPRDVWCVHADIDDFFMKGSSMFLADNAAKIIGDPKIRELVRKGIRFLLDHQFVSSSAFPGKLFQMVEGSSQGKIHSSAVAVAAFLSAAEFNNIGIATGRFKSEYGISLFLRYIDNLLFFVVGNPQPLINKLKSFGCYKTKLEEVSQDGVDFLDLRLFKGPGFELSGRFDYKPILRNKGRMLSPFSDHPLEVLQSWPRAYMQRLYERSSRIAYFLEARQHFINKLISCGFSREYTNWLCMHCNYIRPHDSSSRRPFVATKTNVVWLVLPFHPVFGKAGLKAHIRQFCEQILYKDLLHDAFESVDIPQIRVAWKLHSMPFGSSLIEW